MNQRHLAVWVGLALLATACGGDLGSATTTTTTAVDSDGTSTTIAEATTTTTEPETTTTDAPTTTTIATTTTGRRAIASGSGCAPPGDILPDGEWFGFLEGFIETGTARLVFDLACHFEGAEADLAAVEDGAPVASDGSLEFYPYVRNQNPKVFEIPVAADAKVDDFMLSGEVGLLTWIHMPPPADGCHRSLDFPNCPTWVRIQGGTAVRLYGMLPEWAGDDRG